MCRRAGLAEYSRRARDRKSLFCACASRRPRLARTGRLCESPPQITHAPVVPTASLSARTPAPGLPTNCERARERGTGWRRNGSRAPRAVVARRAVSTWNQTVATRGRPCLRPARVLVSAPRASLVTAPLGVRVLSRRAHRRHLRECQLAGRSASHTLSVCAGLRQTPRHRLPSSWKKCHPPDKFTSARPHVDTSACPHVHTLAHLPLSRRASAATRLAAAQRDKRQIGTGRPPMPVDLKRGGMRTRTRRAL